MGRELLHLDEVTTIRLALLVCLMGCRGSSAPPATQGSSPEPAKSGTAEPAGVVDAAPVVVDAPVPVTADLQCYANGPKEYVRIETDVGSMTGTLERMTTGPVPDRVIKYRAVPDGPAAFDLVFVEYGPGDYQRTGNRRPAKPREKLKPGESVIARVQVVGRQSRIFSREVDLHTGMTVQEPDHSYPCNLSVQGGVVRTIP